MSKQERTGSLPGQQTMDINALRVEGRTEGAKAVTPVTVKPITPTKPGTVAPAAKVMPKSEVKDESAPLYDPEKPMTLEAYEKMKSADQARYQEEKHQYAVEQSKERQKRSKELRKKFAQQAEDTSETTPEAPDELEEYDDAEDDLTSFKATKKRQERICKKYKIKPKELRKGVEQARKLFVPKMMTSEKQSVVLALIELLEFGDI